MAPSRHLANAIRVCTTLFAKAEAFPSSKTSGALRSTGRTSPRILPVTLPVALALLLHCFSLSTSTAACGIFIVVVIVFTIVVTISFPFFRLGPEHSAEPGPLMPSPMGPCNAFRSSSPHVVVTHRRPASGNLQVFRLDPIGLVKVQAVVGQKKAPLGGEDGD